MHARKEARMKRARRSREQMKRKAFWRLSVFRSGRHLYAQVMSVSGGQIVAAASTLEQKLKSDSGNPMEKAHRVGELVAERAVSKGTKDVVFDRSGYRYHGRVKALASGARAGGLKF